MSTLSLAGHTLSLPIAQGGMGVGVSLGRLAGHVAALGGLGTISTAVTGFQEPDFETDPDGANLQALKSHVQQALSLAKGAGVVAINAMVATRQYADSIRAAVESGVQAVISGAGLPMDLPGIVPEEKVALGPIVSSGRAASLICRAWDKRFRRAPDLVVVEGSQAGGHLGFSHDQMREHTAPSLETIVKEVSDALAPFREKYKKAIPVFAAGGVWGREKMAGLRQAGADGVQLATPFIATEECDASQGFKDVILEARDKDVCIIPSPVGMPGRAVRTPLLQRLEKKKQLKPEKCISCLTPCNPKTAPYCISQALIRAVQGDRENGLFFCGGKVGQINKMTTVRQLMEQLMRDWRNEQ